SSPQLQTLVCGGLARGSFSTGQEGYRQSESNSSLCVSRTATPLVVIPSAQPLSQSSDEGMAELIGGASSHGISSDDRGRVCSEVTVESVVPFVESAAPQLLGHHSKPDPEPLYNRVPSVNRSMTLEDCARYISTDTLDRTVYDLDSLARSSGGCGESVSISQGRK
ncbi:hypothetical protein GBAR_LOCUS14617, partial [Geodia barretti]